MTTLTHARKTNSAGIPGLPLEPYTDCMSVLLGAGFESWEVYIPFRQDDDRPYLLTVWTYGTAGNRSWTATVSDTLNEYVEKARAEGRTAAEAMWNVSKPSPDAAAWAGDTAPLAGRLTALASRLWAAAVYEAKEEDDAIAEKYLRAADDSVRRYEQAVRDRDEAMLATFGFTCP